MIGSIVAACGGVAFSAIGVGALIAPGPSSVQYGLPSTDRTALALVRAIGARDVVLGVIILALLAARDRTGLQVVLGVSIFAAAGDAIAVITGRPDARPQHLGVHIGGAAALVVAWQLVQREG